MERTESRGSIAGDSMIFEPGERKQPIDLLLNMYIDDLCKRGRAGGVCLYIFNTNDEMGD